MTTCKTIDGVILSVHVAGENTRHDVSSLRKVLHLVDVERLRIACGTEIFTASHIFGINCFGEAHAAHIKMMFLI
jgi:hypothetical protein